MAKFVFLLAFTLVSTCVLAATNPLQGLLPNGNFEEQPKAADVKKTVLLHKTALPKWEITGLVEYIHGGPQPGGMYFPVANGVHAIKLSNAATISQTIAVKKGSLYAVTFGASRTCAQQQVLRVSVPPHSGDLPLQTLYCADGGDVYAYGFKANDSSLKLTFSNPSVNEDPNCGPIIDVVAVKELLPPKATNLNLVKNGGFEEGPYGLSNSTNGVLLPPRQQDITSPLPGWIIESIKAVKLIDSKYFNVPSGLAAIELIAGRESAVAQIIRTIPNKLYKLTFAIGDAKNFCHGDMMVEAFAGKDTLKAPFKSEAKGEWKMVSMEFKAISTRTRLSFYSSYYHIRVDDTVSLCGPVIDQVKVLSVRS
ncbi:protein TEEBE-like [Rutidosis leptorrhynchoides]|uniref:protein TEEBE-like n=1 Tax=Rutidosis leptorrhynchoides TaxID=125765 RepID=UPI003A994820